MRDLFRAFILIRPFAIVAYTSMSSVMTIHKANYTVRTLRERKLAEIEYETMEAINEAEQ